VFGPFFVFGLVLLVGVMVVFFPAIKMEWKGRVWRGRGVGEGLGVPFCKAGRNFPGFFYWVFFWVPLDQFCFFSPWLFLFLSGLFFCGRGGWFLFLGSAGVSLPSVWPTAFPLFLSPGGLGFFWVFG